MGHPYDIGSGIIDERLDVRVVAWGEMAEDAASVIVGGECRGSRGPDDVAAAVKSSCLQGTPVVERLQQPAGGVEVQEFSAPGQPQTVVIVVH
jgi:hypothetical protein